MLIYLGLLGLIVTYNNSSIAESSHKKKACAGSFNSTRTDQSSDHNDLFTRAFALTNMGNQSKKRSQRIDFYTYSVELFDQAINNMVGADNLNRELYEQALLGRVNLLTNMLSIYYPYGDQHSPEDTNKDQSIIKKIKRDLNILRFLQTTHSIIFNALGFIDLQIALNGSSPRSKITTKHFDKARKNFDNAIRAPGESYHYLSSYGHALAVYHSGKVTVDDLSAALWHSERVMALHENFIPGYYLHAKLLSERLAGTRPENRASSLFDLVYENDPEAFPDALYHSSLSHISSLNFQLGIDKLKTLLELNTFPRLLILEQLSNAYFNFYMHNKSSEKKTLLDQALSYSKQAARLAEDDNSPKMKSIGKDVHQFFIGQIRAL